MPDRVAPCRNCNYYQRGNQDAYPAAPDECRRFPPVVVVVNGAPRSMFPQALATCGEYRDLT